MRQRRDWRRAHVPAKQQEELRPCERIPDATAYTPTSLLLRAAASPSPALAPAPRRQPSLCLGRRDAGKGPKARDAGEEPEAWDANEGLGARATAKDSEPGGLATDPKPRTPAEDLEPGEQD